MTCGDPADTTVLHRRRLYGAPFTSSFAEEAAAMQLALEWATDNHPEDSRTTCTDSKLLLWAIERRSPVTHNLSRRQNSSYNNQRHSFSMYPRDASFAEHLYVHHQQICGQRRCKAGSPGPTGRMRSVEPATPRW